MTIDFYDEESTYGRIETEESVKSIEKLLKEYIKTNEEEYNIDDFFDFLTSKKIKFNTINLVADTSIYF